MVRLAELAGKELVNLIDGARIGKIGDSDLIVDSATGQIESIILPKGNLLGFLNKNQSLIIPWDAIVRIGTDVIIVELENTLTHTNYKEFL
ncbi:MAG: YlmC/YmxH family sporulation protein [Clostridia bacterium]|nr:YlmC/YmxH family sporulation protein [Clostridia bacterium]